MGGNAEQRPLDRHEIERIINNRLTGEYERLRWTPGFCIDKLSWDRLQELIQLSTEESLGKLGRKPADIAVYWSFRSQKLKEFASIADYVKITKLDFAAEKGDDGLVRAGLPPPELNGKPHITFKENDFPYHVDEGIEHHNVWCTRPLTNDELAQVLKEHRDGWEVLYFKNPESLASIPAVWHGHVISRRKPC